MNHVTAELISKVRNFNNAKDLLNNLISLLSASPDLTNEEICNEAWNFGALCGAKFIGIDPNAESISKYNNFKKEDIIFAEDNVNTYEIAFSLGICRIYGNSSKNPYESILISKDNGFNLFEVNIKEDRQYRHPKPIIRVSCPKEMSEYDFNNKGLV